MKQPPDLVNDPAVPREAALSHETTDSALEVVLRHLIAQVQQQPLPPDEQLVGVGAQLVFAAAGVRYMSLRDGLEARSVELLSAAALVRAAAESAPPGVRQLLAQVDELLTQATKLFVDEQPEPQVRH